MLYSQTVDENPQWVKCIGSFQLSREELNQLRHLMEHVNTCSTDGINLGALISNGKNTSFGLKGPTLALTEPWSFWRTGLPGHLNCHIKADIRSQVEVNSRPRA